MHLLVCYLNKLNYFIYLASILEWWHHIVVGLFAIVLKNSTGPHCQGMQTLFSILIIRG
jgi:hypothetical protein